MRPEFFDRMYGMKGRIKKAVLFSGGGERSNPENPVILSKLFLHFSFFAGFFCLLIQCGLAPTAEKPGGTSTEVIVSLEGHLVNEDGSKSVGAVVYLRPKDYLPQISKISARASLKAMDTTSTDSLGNFKFDSIAAGTYALECMDGEPGNGALIDSVVIENPDSTVKLATDTLKPLGSIAGQIQMPESLSASRIRVMVYGLDRVVTPDSVGNYTISGLAEGAYSLRIQILSGDGQVVPGVSVVSEQVTTVPTVVLPGADRIYATRAAGAITIDGTLNESAWGVAQKITFSRPDFTENMVTVRTLWDSTNLYVSYAVEDTSLEVDNVPGPLWKDDGPEFFLSADHDTSSSLIADDYQFVVNVLGEDTVLNRTKTITASILSAVDTTAIGYNLEMAIPWALLGKQPAAGLTMGVLFGLNDVDNGIGSQVDWLALIDWVGSTNPNAWKIPSLWGDLILK